MQQQLRANSAVNVKPIFLSAIRYRCLQEQHPVLMMV